MQGRPSKDEIVAQRGSASDGFGSSQLFHVAGGRDHFILLPEKPKQAETCRPKSDDMLASKATLIWLHVPCSEIKSSLRWTLTKAWVVALASCGAFGSLIRMSRLD